MKIVSSTFYIMAFVLSYFLQGCSPHGDLSRVTRIGGGDSITQPSLFGGKFKNQLSAGSSSNQLTAANYKVNISVGSQFTQTSTVTGGSYKVYTSFNKKIAQ